MRRYLIALLLPACIVGDDTPIPSSTSEDGPADSALTAATPVTWPRLAIGDSNPNVTTLQYLLTWNGFPAAKTGAFDGATRTAVQEFQRSRSLSADGIAGPKTWEEVIVTASVNEADAGEAVSAVQYLLKNRYGANLAVTGTLGPTTLAALRAFQTSRCLAPTGVAGRYTWNALVAEHSFCKSPVVAAASSVLDAHRAGTLTLWNETFGRADGADPLSNITATATGGRAKTSCYGGAPCTTVLLSERLVSGMARLREQRGFDYFVTSIAGASHSVGSLHYDGRAFDVDEVNGVRIQGDSATARAFMAACRELGAIEVLGPNNDPGHQDHVHCAW